MPETPHKRLQVITIQPVRSALERISAVTGSSMGSIVRDFLEEAVPGLEAMAEALEMVPKSPGEALARMSRALNEAQVYAQQTSFDLDEKRTLIEKAVRKQKATKKALTKAASKKTAAKGAKT